MIEPPISEADVGRWFVTRVGGLILVIGFDKGGYPVRAGYDDELVSWTDSGFYYGPSNRHPCDLVSRATPADFIRAALSMMPQHNYQLEVLADYAEQLGSPLAQAIREAIR